MRYNPLHQYLPPITEGTSPGTLLVRATPKDEHPAHLVWVVDAMPPPEHLVVEDSRGRCETIAISELCYP